MKLINRMRKDNVKDNNKPSKEEKEAIQLLARLIARYLYEQRTKTNTN
jgi:hypothetical protein